MKTSHLELAAYSDSTPLDLDPNRPFDWAVEVKRPIKDSQLQLVLCMPHSLRLENQAPGSGFGRERGYKSLPYDLKTFPAQYLGRKSCASSGHTFRSLQTQARHAGQEVA